MNLTPKEAAAKYRSLEYRGLGAWYTPDGECLDYEEVAALRHTLADAYLEQNPADDEEAIAVRLNSAVPTEEGWYFVQYPRSIPTAVRVIRFGNVLGVADESRGAWRPFDGTEINVRWSRRFNIIN